MANSQRSDQDLGIFPQPRRITRIEGATELSSDVRLATSDVLPFIRKTIRSSLSGAGVRVVANKKQSVVSINVVSSDNLNLQDVPESGRENYYELSLVDNMIEVRTHSQMGAMWGAQTFAAIFRTFGHGQLIPNLRIRDWSENIWRGLFIRTCWGMERMAPDQWTALMDCLLRNKMNMLGVNVCGAVADPNDGTPVDMLLAPSAEEPELQTELHLQWYSPEKSKWQEDTRLPRIFTEDHFQNLATSAREKGLRLAPGLEVATFSRVLAKSQGEEKLFSLSNSELRERLRSFFQCLSSNYLKDEKGLVLVSFGSLTDEAEARTLFGETPYVAEDFLVWLLENVVAETFEAMMVDGTVLFGDNARVGPRFMERLQELQLADKLRLSWNDRAEFEAIAGKDSGDSGGLGETIGGHWLSPSICRGTGTEYLPRFVELEESCRGEKGDGVFQGTLAVARFDTAYLDHIQLLAQLTWNPQEEQGALEDILTRSVLVYGEMAECYQKGRHLLVEAVSVNSVNKCFADSSGEERGDEDYPVSVLREFTRKGRDEVLLELRQAGVLARSAIETLRPVADAENGEFDDFLIKSARSLLAEAARVEGTARCFAVLLEKAGESDGELKVDKETGEEARQALLAGMQLIEVYKPPFLQPAALAGFNRLLKFLEA